ncbi:hypothetical protein [Metaplanococcus flavidus]|uniref:ZIP Zinc transporter n=1 Tax=Metaplanococcus flavidus TaxID=569883 RepID=A0ABW3LGH5_9BACL
MNGINWLSIVFVAGFIVVHFSSKYLKLSTSDPRSPWLSLAGGATISYVFLFLFPELNKYLEVINEAVSGSWLSFFSEYTYLLALFGLLVYYGLDVVAKTKSSGEAEKEGNPSFGVFMVHISLFFLYNLIIGYLLVREDFASNWELALYFLALALHFGATDHTLKDLHKEDYDKYGRWFLVSAIFIGWLIAVLFTVHEVIVAISVSLLAGGILVNVFKDELRVGSIKNYTAFLGGAAVIAVLFMLVK